MSNLWDLSHIQPRMDSVLDGDTIPALFWNAVQSRGPNVWLREKDLGIWRSWTWRASGEAVAEIAAGLMHLGFAAGDTASILSNTVLEWVLCDLAVLSCGGVSNGIYPTDAASQVHYLCEDSRTSVLFVEDDEQLDKALEVRAQLPGLRKIVVFDMNGDGAFNAADGAGDKLVSGTQTGAGKQTIRAARVFDPSANAEKRVNSGVEFGRQSWRRQPAN